MGRLKTALGVFVCALFGLAAWHHVWTHPAHSEADFTTATAALVGCRERPRGDDVLELSLRGNPLGFRVPLDPDVGFDKGRFLADVHPGDELTLVVERDGLDEAAGAIEVWGLSGPNGGYLQLEDRLARERWVRKSAVGIGIAAPALGVVLILASLPRPRDDKKRRRRRRRGRDQDPDPAP